MKMFIPAKKVRIKVMLGISKGIHATVNQLIKCWIIWEEKGGQDLQQEIDFLPFALVNDFIKIVQSILEVVFLDELLADTAE